MLIRLRNPCTRLRRRTFGCHVRLVDITLAFVFAAYQSTSGKYSRARILGQQSPRSHRISCLNDPPNQTRERPDEFNPVDSPAIPRQEPRLVQVALDDKRPLTVGLQRYREYQQRPECFYA